MKKIIIILLFVVVAMSIYFGFFAQTALAPKDEVKPSSNSTTDENVIEVQSSVDTTDKLQIKAENKIE